MIRQELIEEAKKLICGTDPAHDIHHALRVMTNGEYIANREGGKLEIIIPAALFHDAITYPKGSSRSKDAPVESAQLARSVLERHEYSETGIEKVEEAILEHSYSAGNKPQSLESAILQDADRLECTGAIAIMRTFCSAGQLNRSFYLPSDPFCEKRKPNTRGFSIDLFYERLLKMYEQMNTQTAQHLAYSRVDFMKEFLTQLGKELKTSGYNEQSPIEWHEP